MTTYRVEGMTCDGCVRAVGNALGEALPGVEARVDLGAGTVTLDDAADEARVRAAIEAAGFDFGGRVEASG